MVRQGRQQSVMVCQNVGLLCPDNEFPGIIQYEDCDVLELVPECVTELIYIICRAAKLGGKVVRSELLHR